MTPDRPHLEPAVRVAVKGPPSPRCQALPLVPGVLFSFLSLLTPPRPPCSPGCFLCAPPAAAEAVGRCGEPCPPWVGLRSTNGLVGPWRFGVSPPHALACAAFAVSPPGPASVTTVASHVPRKCTAVTGSASTATGGKHQPERPSEQSQRARDQPLTLRDKVTDTPAICQSAPRGSVRGSNNRPPRHLTASVSHLQDAGS